MFAKTASWSALIVAILLVTPNAGESQPPGKSDSGGPGGGDGFRKMKGPPSPEKMFGWFAKGTGGEVIDFNKMSPESRLFMRGALEKMGMPSPPDNAVITRAQFVAAANQAMAMRAAAAAENGGGDMGQQGLRIQPPGPDTPQENQGGGDASTERQDRPERKNRDKEKKNDQDQPLVALRYGKLPKDLPEWFEKYDTDKDGQVGLYEWRAAGKPIAEFQAMDLNGDGLITADELLRYLRIKTEDAKLANAIQADEEGTPPSKASSDSGSSRGSGGRGMGGMGGGNERGAWGGGGGDRGGWGSKDGKGRPDGKFGKGPRSDSKSDKK